jgi:hypothetical protein
MGAMRSISRWTWFALVIACGPQAAGSVDGDGPGDDGTSAADDGVVTETASASAGPATATATATDPSATATVADTGVDETTDACGEVDETGAHLDVGPGEPECSIFDQDCEEGWKCIPFAFSNRLCVAIVVESLDEGEPCEQSPGVDPCGPLHWCGPVAGGSGEGTCVPLCTGTPDDPVCPRGMICVIDDEDVVAYCAPPCDPFARESCSEDLSCQPTRHGMGCVPYGYADAGEHCYQHDTCVAGLGCHSFEGCCSSQCCAPFCDAAHPCEVGECVPLDPPIAGPEGLGLCG